MSNPNRGEIWMVVLDPVKGHEQGGTRPALIVSNDRYNHGPAGLVIVAPLSTRGRPIPIYVQINPPDVPQPSLIKCDQVRCISKDRLKYRFAAAPSSVMSEVEDRLRIMMDL